MMPSKCPVPYLFKISEIARFVLPLLLLLLPCRCPGALHGVTLGGSSGLITTPIPDFEPESRSLAFKTSSYDGRKDYNGQSFAESKNEQVISFRNKFSGEIEASLIYMSFDRNSLANFNGDAGLYGLGVKVSPLEGSRDFCYGFNFAPMTNRESLLADIEQIESLRNIYATFHEQLTSRIDGFFNISAAFAGSQKIIFPDGSRREVDRNDIYTGTLGAKMQAGKRSEFICEFKTGHYRDLFSEDTVRYRLHAGFRLNVRKGQLEILAYDLSSADPSVGFGCSMNF